MQSVTVDGATYTKASVLAKKFNYTTDYIGQLCRAGKVDAQLVGRSWYVREDALLVHKDSRYRSLRENEITSDFNVKSEDFVKNNFVEKVKVMPVLSKNTKRAVLARQGETNFSARMNNITPLKYESDEAELLPKPKILAEPVSIPINLASSEKVKIRLVSPKVSSLAFTELPVVTLQGVLPVSAYESFSDEVVSPVDLPTRTFETKVMPSHQSPKLPKFSKKTSRPVVTKFSPASISPEVAPSSGGGRVLLFSLVLSCLVATMLIAFDSRVVYDGSVSSERLVFNAASLGTVLSFFRF